LIDENAGQAQRSLINLSDLLRYTINLQPLELVPVQEEINTLKQFLTIEKAKYEDQLRVQWQLPDQVADWQIPPLIIQPLVENAIKHGFMNNSEVLTIMISVAPTCRTIRVANDGAPLSSPIVSGQGTEIVKKRLDIHFGARGTFRIFQEGDWVINEIQIHEFA
jgi:LytS/YehU family sensor histidine kinase